MKESHIIEPQSHGRDKIGRDHSDSSGLTSLFYRVIPEHRVESSCFLNISDEGDYTISLGNIGYISKKKKSVVKF